LHGWFSPGLLQIILEPLFEKAAKLQILFEIESLFFIVKAT